MAENHVEDGEGAALGFERLVFFSDAVLAIAITLMTLEIRLPELDSNVTPDQFNAAVQTLAPHILVYVLSFLVIGFYWVGHHRLFRLIRRYDERMVWINLLFLLSVTLVPIATNALGTYPSLPPVTAAYAVAIALMGLMEFILWNYASSRGLAAPVSGEFSAQYISLRILTPPAVFLFSLLIVPVNVHAAQFAWLLILPIFVALRSIFPREHIERASTERGGY